MALDISIKNDSFAFEYSEFEWILKSKTEVKIISKLLDHYYDDPFLSVNDLKDLKLELENLLKEKKLQIIKSKGIKSREPFILAPIFESDLSFKNLKSFSNFIKKSLIENNSIKCQSD